MTPTSNQETYPKRPKCFGYRVVRMLFKTCAAQDIGIDACWLVASIAMTEDAKHYSGAVTYFNDQLQAILGFRKWERLDQARQAAVKGRWLHYERPPSGIRRVAPKYWAMIPSEFETLDDSPMDESELYPSEGDNSGELYPSQGGARGGARGEPSSLSLSLQDGAHGAPPPAEDGRGPAGGKKRRKTAYTPEDMATAEHIWAGVRRINPETKPPRLEAWANTVRLMREQDNRPPDRIRAVFDWANADERPGQKFPGWAFQILSVDNLRAKWDKLTAAMRASGNGDQTAAAPKGPDDEILRKADRYGRQRQGKPQ